MCFRSLIAFSLLVVAVKCIAADGSLNERVDQLVEAKFVGQPAEIASDAEFLRRIWLDLAGRIPSAEQTKKFLADADAKKREKTIDQLLASPHYVEQMRELFNVILMERRGDDKEWEKFLETSFQTNLPWDEIVRNIIAPNSEDETKRGAAFFTTKRLTKSGQQPTDFPGLTRDIGRMFLGMDLQCAQCHDHLFIDDYKQLEFQGLYSVFLNTYIRSDVKFPAVGEKEMRTPLEFTSVFADDKVSTGPRVPFGKSFVIPEEIQNKKPPGRSKEYKAPEYSALSLIAQNLPTAENRNFARNIANRMWFVMMGRGIVHPLDLHHSSNQPSHPKVLELLTDEIVAHKFDLRWLLKQLALTRTYQRSSAIPEGQKAPESKLFQVALERRLTAEQIFRITLQASGDFERLTKKDKDGKRSEDYTMLKGKFLEAFASSPKEPAESYDATVKAALFALNDGKYLDLVMRRDGNVVDQLLKIGDSKKMTELLFLTIYTRLPSAEEVSDITGFLTKHGSGDKREKAIGQVVWAMLTSMEFCVNH